jgi:glutamate synthase (NADPH/NADH) large chain
MVDVLPLDAEDSRWLLATLDEHKEMTGSPLASRVLEHWNEMKASFVKVLPRDYARVMAILQQAAADGLSEDETSQRVMESVHG